MATDRPMTARLWYRPGTSQPRRPGRPSSACSTTPDVPDSFSPWPWLPGGAALDGFAYGLPRWQRAALAGGWPMPGATAPFEFRELAVRPAAQGQGRTALHDGVVAASGPQRRWLTTHTAARPALEPVPQPRLACRPADPGLRRRQHPAAHDASPLTARGAGRRVRGFLLAASAQADHGEAVRFDGEPVACACLLREPAEQLVRDLGHRPAQLADQVTVACRCQVVGGGAVAEVGTVDNPETLQLVKIVGVVFGMGFDTATEVALLATTALLASQASPWYAIGRLPGCSPPG